jgi:glycosyltransferase involved in cell wall biosynthesis
VSTEGDQRPYLGSSKKAVVIATESQQEARDATRAIGLEPVLLLDRFDCARRLNGAAERILAEEIVAAVVHSPDWRRQPLQRLYELAMLRLPVRERFVLDRREVIQLSRGALLAASMRVPLELLAGSACAIREARFALRSRRVATARVRAPDDAVLVIWRGDPTIRTGGSVTHAAGMLGAFRARGLRVGLVTSCEPPAQIAENIDDLAVARPLPPSRRLTREIEELALNSVLRGAARRLLQRLRPGFIYQRHAAFLTVGQTLTAEIGSPLVLEWNGSEAWVRAHWQRGHAATRLFDRVLRSIERDALEQATLVRSVSENAAETALGTGAMIRHLEVIPNGVDTEAIPFAGAPARANANEPTLGWVGSFGPWHGAHVVPRALAELPEEITAVMVGDGDERSVCEQLAVQLGVAHRVRWTGALPHREAVAMLSGCDILVSPHGDSDGQRFFGSPTKIFEYMAIGRPIVASRLEQIAEVLRHGETAILVPPGDARGLAEGICAVLARGDRGIALGRAARMDAERRHSWLARADAVLRCLESTTELEASR